MQLIPSSACQTKTNLSPSCETIQFVRSVMQIELCRGFLLKLTCQSE